MISRAARYTGMTEIKNQFLDLLDFAADCAEEFDMENNTREYLLKHFDLVEGKDAAETGVTMQLYSALKQWEN